MSRSEHWWNGLWGPQARQEVFVYAERGRWTVEHRRRQAARCWHCETEAQARAIFEGLLAAGPGDWRRVTDELRPDP